MIDDINKANTPRLAPENQFPIPAITESVQVQPTPSGVGGGGFFTINLASAADMITPWGKNTKRRDEQLREFLPTEPYLAGAHANVCFRNSVFDWEIQGKSEKIIQAVTDMLMTAIAGDMIGWVPFAQKFSNDLYGQDNGAFIEPIRDPSLDAASKFKGSMAPVIGIAHLDSGACIRTGNIETPVLYTDLNGGQHKLQWYEVIPFSDFPSPIQKMNGVGICAESRILRIAQIMRSIAIFKDENVSGRNVKNIEIIGGVSTTQINDAVKRTIEQADNRGQMRFIEHVILASLDPEKPVSHVQVPLASLPEGFDFDAEMQWFIAGLALGYATDYQEFAPLNGGNIGSGSQSNMLNRKTSGKGPRAWMDMLSNAFKYYGVLPDGYKMVFNDKNQQDEMEKQEVRTAAAEEAAIIVNSKIFPPEVMAKSLVARGIYSQADIDNTPEKWWELAMAGASNESNGQPVGARGGNTVAEDAARTDSGKPKPKAGDRLRKLFGA